MHFLPILALAETLVLLLVQRLLLLIQGMRLELEVIILLKLEIELIRALEAIAISNGVIFLQDLAQFKSYIISDLDAFATFGNGRP